jgi:hypothetical protein
MGLTMAERKAVTKAIATRYKRADKAGKTRIFDELRATRSWQRDHARKALRGAPAAVGGTAEDSTSPLYGPKMVAALIFCWDISINQQRLVQAFPRFSSRARAKTNERPYAPARRGSIEQCSTDPHGVFPVNRSVPVL